MSGVALKLLVIIRYALKLLVIIKWCSSVATYKTQAYLLKYISRVSVSILSATFLV